MSLFDFIRLVYRNFTLISLFAIGLGASAYFFTLNQTSEYVSEAVIYTGLASGINLESDQAKADYHSINNAFDNLIIIIQSRVTMEEAALRLIALHLMQDKPDPLIIGQEAFDNFNMSFPEDLRQKVKADTYERTFQNLEAVYKAYNPYLNDLIRKGNSHYSLKKLKNLSAKRNKSSDMVELAYISDDPGIAKTTLDLVVDVFSRRYREIKESQTGDVVAYFEEEMRKVKSRLNDAEDRLTAFRVKSRVINYVEQTKAIAFKKQNALEDYALRNIDLRATEAALKEIENKLEIREGMLSRNADILSKRNQLKDISSTIAKAQATGDSTLNITELVQQQERIKLDLASQVSQMVEYSNTREGIPGQQLLKEWMDNLITKEKEQVNVDLYKTHLDDIDAEYDRFAPMGSTISRMEREIGVYEREYLEVLHGLNMAKLKQQNIELASNLEVIDSPAFPREPLASKKSIIILAAIMFGIFGSISVLIAIELLDSTLKTPEKAKEITGLEITGALPVVNDSLHKKHAGAFDKAVNSMVSKILLEKDYRKCDGQTIILGMSTTSHQGKTFTMKHVLKELKKVGENACLLSPKTESNEGEQDVFHYEVTPQFMSAHEVKDLVADDLSAYNIVLLELPGWVEGNVPHHIIRQTPLALWVIKADKTWSTAHKTMLADFRKFSTQEPMLILNGIKAYHLDQIIAEVPTRRPAIISWFRKIAKLQFSSTGFKTF